MDTHAGQLAVTEDMVRALVADQRPQLRNLPIRAVRSAGTVNALFRLGETMVVGEPGCGFPLPWSVQTWLPGTDATVDDPGQSAAFAHDLADFVRDVRAIDTGGRTFRGVGRGGHLPDHDDWMHLCFRRRRMNHGDLMPGNLLVAGGRLTGVLDIGDLGPADPALDLVAAWHLLGVVPRRFFRDDLHSDDVQWARGAAWAFQQAMGLVWYYAESNPVMSRIGRRTLRRILAQSGTLG